MPQAGPHHAGGDDAVIERGSQFRSEISGNTGRCLPASPKTRTPAVTNAMVIVTSIHDGT